MPQCGIRSTVLLLVTGFHCSLYNGVLRRGMRSHIIDNHPVNIVLTPQDSVLTLSLEADSTFYVLQMIVYDAVSQIAVRGIHRTHPLCLVNSNATS